MISVSEVKVAPPAKEFIMTSPAERERRKALRPVRKDYLIAEPVQMFSGRGYLFPYACLACRKSFKRKFETGLPDKPCPHCGGVAIGLYRHFKAPPMDDIQQWKKVALLIQHGFRFHHQYDENGNCVPYPATMAEAKVFVLRFAKMKTPKK